MRFLALVLTTGLVCTAFGCGSNVAPVSGKITLDSKPLVNATVIFEPSSELKNPGPGSQGKTDANGQYSLQLTSADTQGATIGKHIVRITAYEGDDGTVPSSAPDSVFRKPILPEKYNAKSDLKFEVTSAGSTSADFDLKSDKASAK